VLRFLAEQISTNTYLNLMDQYQPVYQASHYNQLNRCITPSEYQHAVDLAHEVGLHRLDHRELRIHS
jgi:putative pyruvate formate lyase activating enzyme